MMVKLCLQTALGARTSAFDRFSDIGAVRSVRLGRSSHISALSADIAQDKWQIAPQAFDLG